MERNLKRKRMTRRKKNRACGLDESKGNGRMEGNKGNTERQK